MAIISYQCDTCLRTVDRVENEKGLTVAGRCIITKNCKGKLFFLERTLNKNAKPAPSEEGVLDWYPRKILYNHTQHIQSNQWDIQHNLGGNPIVSVFISTSSTDPSIDVHQVTPERIEYIDENNISVFLKEGDGARVGVAQVILRSSVPSKEQTTIQPRSEYSYTATAPLMSLGFRVPTIQASAPVSITITAQFVNRDSGQTTTVSSEINKLEGGLNNIAWSDMGKFDYTSPSDGYFQTYGFNIPTEYQSNVYSMYITAINDAPLTHRQLLLLLSSTPNQVGDEIVDTIFDWNTITAQNVKTALKLSTSTVLINDQYVEAIFPPIQKQ